MEIISTREDLEKKISECNDLLVNESDDAMRRMFNSFRMDFSSEAPSDPFSPEYRRFQMSLYETMAGKPYALNNERTHFDIEGAAERPFPYYLQSSLTAGHHLLAIGFMLCKLFVPPRSRILEFGPGWGNSTLELARNGFEVTAVDIEPNFCEVVRRRATRLGLDIDVVEADFFWSESTKQKFDAVLFFECFHHCDDHIRLLNALHNVIVPGGSVFLASEPIIENYGTPWGVRMDGEALWATRNFGWMELGFDEAYFREALARTGWSGIKHVCATVPWASVWQLRQRVEAAVDEPLAQEVAVPPPPRSGGGELDRAALLSREIEAIYRSTSWRVTRPLRSLKRRLTHSKK